MTENKQFGISEQLNDTISRAAVVDAIEGVDWYHINRNGEMVHGANDAEHQAWYKADDIYAAIERVPSAQPEPCEYYALCRHGRDERKLRASLGICEYCNEDSDGYVKPIEKNGHAFVRFGMNGWNLELKAKGWHGETKIQYCPICGRKLKNDK